MTVRTASLIIGLLFLGVGILGFSSNPIVGESPDAIFHADALHNWIHIGSGILFLLVSFGAPGAAGTFCKIFGAVYLLIGIAGLLSFGTDGMGKILGILHVNSADNFLHIGLGVLIFLAGTLRGPASTYQ